MDQEVKKRPIVVRKFPKEAVIYRESDSDESLPDLVTPDGRPLDINAVSHINVPVRAEG